MRFQCVILEFTDMDTQLGRLLVVIISPLKLQYQDFIFYERREQIDSKYLQLNIILAKTILKMKIIFPQI